jgi:hypothetical protein
MINKNSTYILIGLLLIVIFQGFFEAPKGISPEEELYRLKIHDLGQEKLILIKQNDSLNNKLNSFENEILKNDSIIDNSTNEQLDSMFTEYFKR